MAHRLVLDTNVLVAGLRSRRGASYRVLRLIEYGRVRPVLSVPLVFEYEEVLKREAGVLLLRREDLDAVLDDLCALGERRAIHYLWRPTLRDPHDELVLEVAVAAGGIPIVTHNVKDFTGSEHFAVPIYTPRDWLIAIGEKR
ncbi:MAG: PIN domain-containing protein [Gemmatimonadetes bacterium]|nr:PIN domain-containing protein [Gemmatimonadota bacterium]MBI2403641.1 PIN domain-containing protein [Gemmatimonadota bacterium]